MVHNLGAKFVMFLIVDSLLPGVIGIITTFLLIISILTSNVMGITLILLLMTATLQICLRLTAYHIANRYDHRYSKMDYVKVLIFSIIEYPTYRILDTYYFLHGSIAYLIQRNHTWNKVERTGLVSIYPEDLTMKAPEVIQVTQEMLLEQMKSIKMIEKHRKVG